MKRFFLVTAALVTTLMLFSACASVQPIAKDPNKVYELVVLNTNDHHGALVPTASDKPGKGGLALRSAYINEVRAKNKNVLLLDAGDINTGTAASNMFKAEPDILAYNLLKYDAVALGNHEFDSDIAVLEKQLKLADFPWISANVMRSTNKLLGDNNGYVVKDFDGFRVGIFGLTTTRTEVIAKPDKSLTFTNEIEAAKKMVELLRKKEKCDIVIALGHLGSVVEYANQVTSLKLAQNVPGIDLIVDGHSHTYMAEALVENGVPIVSANEWGKYVGTSTIKIQNGKIQNFSWQPVAITTDAFKPDAATVDLLDPYLAKAKADLGTVVMTATEKFEFGNRLSRYREIALGDMISDGATWYLREKLGQTVDFSITNGGNIRTELPAGAITKEHIATVLPFDNWIYVLTLKGSDVITLFDFIASINQGAGGFAQISKEVRYTITYDEKGTNGKISNLTISGKPIDSAKNYKLATNDYLATGGDGYTVLKKATESFNTSVTLRDITMDYVQQLPQPVDPKKIPDGRITLVGGVNP